MFSIKQVDDAITYAFDNSDNIKDIMKGEYYQINRAEFVRLAINNLWINNIHKDTNEHTRILYNYSKAIEKLLLIQK